MMRQETRYMIASLEDVADRAVAHMEEMQQRLDRAEETVERQRITLERLKRRYVEINLGKEMDGVLVSLSEAARAVLSSVETPDADMVRQLIIDCRNLRDKLVDRLVKIEGEG